MNLLNTKKRQAFVLAFLLILVWSTSLGAQDKGRQITDMAGRTVTIPSKVDRVVVIKGACMVPGILSALGCGDAMVSGLCFKNGPDDLQLKVQPSYAKLEVLSPNESGVNLEQLMALKPDVVFVWNNVKNVDQLAAAGIPVVVTDISSWDKVRTMFGLIGTIMGRETQAAKLVAYMDSTASSVKQRLASLPSSERKRALFVSGLKPLTVMGNTSHNSFMIELAGGISAATDLNGHFVDVSMESLYQVDPDVIFVSAASKAGRDQILTDPAWQNLRAVKNHQVWLCPTGVFFWDKPSAEIPLFLLWQARVLYPQIFDQAGFQETVKEYYLKFFGYTLSSQELAVLLGGNGKDN